MELESTRIFVKVVQQGSFSKAAQLLKLPLSTVSRTISRLEAEIGTKLLHRTTRSLKLTAPGRVYFESSASSIQTLEDARRSLQGSDSIVAGIVKITAPEDLGKYAVTPIIAELMREYPELIFDFLYTDQVIDLVGEGFDLAIRVGQLESSRLTAKKVGQIEMVLVASPEYLAKNPKIREPRDLESQSVIFFSPDLAASKLKLQSKTRSVTIKVEGRAHGNQMESLLALSSLHAGISIVPHFACKQLLNEKHLVRVLPEWSVGGYPAYIVSTGGPMPSARVRLVSNRLAEALMKILNSSGN